MIDTQHIRELVDAAKEAEFDLREWLGFPKLPPDPKLGHIGAHRPTLNFGDFVVSPRPVPPSAVHRSHFSFKWGMLANDQLGDCGEAMAIHAIEQLLLNSQTKPPGFADQDAVALYENVGGYVPGDPSTDQGTDNDVLVKVWREQGIACASDGSIHKIVGSLAVDVNDVDLNRIALWEIGVLCRAVGLPNTAQGQHQWRVIGDGETGDSALGSWGYHDIVYVSYDQRFYRNVTWGTELLVELAFDTTYGVQGFVPITEKMAERRGVSPSGVNWTALNEALAAA